MRPIVMSQEQKTVLTDSEQLIYELLFSKKTIFPIDLQEYCEFYEQRSKFRDHIRTILKRGGVIILDDRIIHTNETVIWKIELRK